MTSTEYQPAAVARCWNETHAMFRLRLEAGGLARLHLRPGQYIQVRTASGGVSYFALANPPGDTHFELLIKRGSPVADELARLEVGMMLDVSSPGGRGFPIEDHAGMDLLLFAAGSGIAPIRSVITYVLADRSRFGRITLYYGHRDPAEFAYTRDYEKWAMGEVEINRVISGRRDSDFPMARQHVQDAVMVNPPEVSNAVAYLCGMKEMIQQVTETLQGLGMKSDRVFLNY